MVFMHTIVATDVTVDAKQPYFAPCEAKPVIQLLSKGCGFDAATELLDAELDPPLAYKHAICAAKQTA